MIALPPVPPPPPPPNGKWDKVKKLILSILAFIWKTIVFLLKLPLMLMKQVFLFAKKHFVGLLVTTISLGFVFAILQYGGKFGGIGNIIMALSLIVAGIVSIVLTMAILVATLYLKNKPARENNHDVKDIWQWFGYCSNTPRLIRAVVTGLDENNGPIVDYILADGVYDQTAKELVPASNPYIPTGPIDKLVWKKFGKRRFGPPIFSSLRPLSIDRVVPVNSIKSASAKIAEMLSGGEKVKKYGLKEIIYRPTQHMDIDTIDGKRFNVISYATVRVFNPEPAFTIYKDNFLETLSERIGGFLSKRIIAMTWDQYKATGKDFAKEDTDKLDADLKNLGVKFENLTMSDPELNATIQDAMELRFRAEEEAAAKREKGRGERDYAISIGEGTARVTELNAVANRKRFEELIILYRKQGMSEVAATEEAIRVILETQNAEAIGKLTTYVAGGSNTGIVLNPGDKKP